MKAIDAQQNHPFGISDASYLGKGYNPPLSGADLKKDQLKRYYKEGNLDGGFKAFYSKAWHVSDRKYSKKKQLRFQRQTNHVILPDSNGNWFDNRKCKRQYHHTSSYDNKLNRGISGLIEKTPDKPFIDRGKRILNTNHSVDLIKPLIEQSPCLTMNDQCKGRNDVNRRHYVPKDHFTTIGDGWNGYAAEKIKKFGLYKNMYI